MNLRASVAAVALGIAAVGISAVGSGAVTAPASAASKPYKNCTEAHNDGRYNIPQDDPAYSPNLDRDGDGLACEPKRSRS